MVEPKDVHVNRPISNLLLRRAVSGFAIPKIFPELSVKKESDLYPRIKPVPLITPQRSLRAPYSDYNRVTYEYEYEAYICQEHGLETEVEDRTVANADDPLNPIEDSALQLQDLIRLDLELEGYNTIINAGITSSSP